MEDAFIIDPSNNKKKIKKKIEKQKREKKHTHTRTHKEKNRAKTIVTNWITVPDIDTRFNPIKGAGINFVNTYWYCKYNLFLKCEISFLSCSLTGL